MIGRFAIWMGVTAALALLFTLAGVWAIENVFHIQGTCASIAAVLVGISSVTVATFVSIPLYERVLRQVYE